MPPSTCSAPRAPTWRQRGFAASGAVAFLLVLLGLARPANGQTLRLGALDLFLTGHLEVGYESNIDGAYPEEEDPFTRRGISIGAPA